ncbi:MAG: hypothetical protein P8010_10195 [Desulfosarcinaceae bacterium]|jgi:hypothetical protein
MLSADRKRQLLIYQRNEITEHHIYRRLARLQKSVENRRILARIAGDEKRHYEQWKGYTGEEAPVDWTRVRLFYWITRLFGQDGGNHSKTAESRYLYRHHLCHHSRFSDSAVSFPEQLLLVAGLHAHSCRAHYWDIQFLHIRGNGSTL